MSSGDDARLRPDGSCELFVPYDGVVTATWSSVEMWAFAWLEEWRTEAFCHASDFVRALIDQGDPAVVDVLLVLVESTGGDEEMLAYVGTGPLEDLLSEGHSRVGVVDGVERAARQDPLFRRALWRVWLGEGVPQPVRERFAVLGARDFVAEHAMTERDLAAYFASRRARGMDPSPPNDATHVKTPDGPSHGRGPGASGQQ